MKVSIIVGTICLIGSLNSIAQSEPKSPSIYKIPADVLAGEGLEFKKQKDPNRKVYQKQVYNGTELAVFVVAIGTGITNEFKSFPMEEFIFWMNGKALVEPEGESPFPVYSGDYFVQAKGFRGKWNFIDIGELHLELALIAKNRPDSTIKSPIKKALVLDRDILSGVSHPEKGIVYKGPELTVRLLVPESGTRENKTKERMLHVVNGVVKVTTSLEREHTFYPGDFFMVPQGLECSIESGGLQNFRLLEVTKT